MHGVWSPDFLQPYDGAALFFLYAEQCSSKLLEQNSVDVCSSVQFTVSAVKSQYCLTISTILSILFVSTAIMIDARFKHATP